MFASILSLSTQRLVKTFAVLAITSSHSAEPCDNVNLSLLEFAKSLSCQRSAFSYVGIMKERTILARPEAFSDLIGFFL